jgi:hypothetical protein
MTGRRSAPRLLNDTCLIARPLTAQRCHHIDAESNNTSAPSRCGLCPTIAEVTQLSGADLARRRLRFLSPVKWLAHVTQFCSF